MVSCQLKYTVAAVQASPVFFDAAATTDRTVHLIKEAASNGAALVVFPELWLPGYPFWLWAYPYGATLDFIAKYQANAVTHTGHEADVIRQACRENKITACIGVAEIDHGTMYMAQWLISAEGQFIGRRRKVKPSIVERTCFGEGDGSDIRVYDTPLGRLGALQCWEHTQSLLKYAMASQHEQVHCASWPNFAAKLPHQSLGMDSNYASNVSYSVETGAYTIVSTAPLSQQNQDVLVNGDDSLRQHLPLGGGLTQIFSPEGEPLAERPPHDAQTIVYASVDLSKTILARHAMDSVGHYARNDLFRVELDTTPRQHIHIGPHGGKRGNKSRLSRAELFDDTIVVAEEGKESGKIVL